MKIKISNNTTDVSCQMEILPGETKGLKQKELAKFIYNAYKAAELIWKKYPQFKLVVFGTYSEEEEKLIEQGNKKGKWQDIS